VFGLAFGFGFCPLKAKSQPKGWIQEAAFGTVKTYIEEILTTFSGFHQTIFSFLTAHSLQQLFPQLTDHSNFFHSHSPTKQTLSLNLSI
jgi:hypothetical protein